MCIKPLSNIGRQPGGTRANKTRTTNKQNNGSLAKQGKQNKDNKQTSKQIRNKTMATWRKKGNKQANKQNNGLAKQGQAK